MKKSDPCNVYDLLSEWENGDDELTFDAFQTPETIMQERLPPEVKLKFTSDQTAILQRILDRAAVQQPDEYLSAYEIVNNAVTSNPPRTDFTVNRNAAIKILRAIELTNTRKINTNLNVRDALWGLRNAVLAIGGIKETE